jgi:thiamine-phosphate pyrophosphorylase
VDRLARLQLARAAREFAARANSSLPGLVLLTDDEHMTNPLASILDLPRGSLVVLRSRDRAHRIALARPISRIVRTRGLFWIIADDPALAAKSGAHGAHFPERKLALAAHWRVRRPDWILTCAAHSLAACARVARIGADAVLLAPVFATLSHPNRSHIGPLRLRTLANLMDVPIFALGGIDAQSAKQLTGARLAGLASVGGLACTERWRRMHSEGDAERTSSTAGRKRPRRSK